MDVGNILELLILVWPQPYKMESVQEFNNLQAKTKSLEFPLA